jgi:hypothetical protein
MNGYQPGDNLRWQQEHNGTLNPAVAGEPTVTVEGRTYYTVPSTGDVICPECGWARPASRITDHVASEHDTEFTGDDDTDYDDGNTLIAGVLYRPDGYEAEPAGDFPAQGGGCDDNDGALDYLPPNEHDMRAFGRVLDDEYKVQQAVSAGIDEDAAREALRDENRVMKLTPREVTQLEAALDEDRVNHNTVREQTGEDA